MRIGTPRFVGARLREAREARGLTGIALADLLGVTRAAVSQYETSSKTPSPEIMQGICDHLHLPAAFFFRPYTNANHGPVFYRSMAAATKTARMRAERRGQWLADIVGYFARFVTFHKPAIPDDIGVPSELARCSTQQIESTAMAIRQAWDLGEGPLGNVAWILESKGVMMARCALGAETLDALSWIDNGVPFFMLGSERASAVRSRFDACHELGHAILHRGIPERALFKKDEFKLIERQAHRFAAAFLLPGRAFSDDFYSATLDALVNLKKKWHVSVKLLIKRADELGMIKESVSEHLYIGYGRRGWNRHEPLDDELRVETPVLLRKAADLLLTKGIQSHEDIQAALPYRPSDIEELAGLPRGYLQGTRTEVRVMAPALRRKLKKPQPAGPAAIVQLPRREPS